MSQAQSRIRIMRIGPDEWPLWRPLRLAALREAPYAFSSRLADWEGDGDTQSRWRERLASVPFNVIGHLDDVEAGMASATSATDQTIDLVSMWVAPFARGQRVGDALVQAIIDWCRRQGALRIGLDVFETNSRAVALYRRHGFVDGGPLEAVTAGLPQERRMLLNL